MPTTTSFSFGYVLLVPFPFTDLTTSKRRPAVVISSAQYNERRLDVIVMAVTSQQGPARARARGHWLRDWKAAGLLKPSILKPIVTTLDKSVVIRRLGSLTEHDRSVLHRVLTETLGT